MKVIVIYLNESGIEVRKHFKYWYEAQTFADALGLRFIKFDTYMDTY